MEKLCDLTTLRAIFSQRRKDAKKLKLKVVLRLRSFSPKSILKNERQKKHSTHGFGHIFCVLRTLVG